MRHRKAGVKLNRTSSHRDAMFRNMVTSLFKYDRIKTTDAKAKELRRWSDRLITLAKRGDLHARRQALAIVREKDVVHKLFEEAPKRFGNVAGGYTRVVKIGFRAGDAAPLSLVELVDADGASKKKKKKAKPAAAPAPEVTAAAPQPEAEPETEAPADAPEVEAAEAAPETETAEAAPEAETAEPEAPAEAQAAAEPESEPQAAASGEAEPAPADKEPETK